ncbi:hypothetical protein HOF65_06745 [bacterium]|nr:hypothetical protein [bacterium]MBT3853621.1 hypothetical protein [bacterium]MBT4633090.1 hypothetical protein [bacterium]MBT6778635.1 hypothetical protein [bacterium]
MYTYCTSSLITKKSVSQTLSIFCKSSSQSIVDKLSSSAICTSSSSFSINRVFFSISNSLIL